MKLKGVLIIWLALFFGSGWALHLPEYRIEPGYVVEVREIDDREVDVVTVETDDGNLWDFYGYQYDGGERVYLFFYTNGTPEIYDDEVASVWVR